MARRHARVFLTSLEPQPSKEVAASVVLVVSELITNALRHGGGGCTLNVIAEPVNSLIAVEDSSSDHPRMRNPVLEGGSGGLGWQLIESLTREIWVMGKIGGGKRFIFKLRATCKKSGILMISLNSTGKRVHSV
ncbi:ATP-binding protein [Streptomyces rubiginosohelvolus]|uniref:ATP-binding protein n=1 Tax=Streptomyces rubiginosohelvolus TaxID=67362 RepID=UPI00343BB4B3